MGIEAKEGHEHIWLPQPGPQVLAVTCPADLVFFGGSRGGGKTDCAIGRQVIGAMKHGYAWNGLFLRKNFKHFNELRRRIDEMIRAGLPAHRVGGDNQTNVIKFDNGARVMLTAIERPEQLEFFQGQQFQEISLEEACQFGFVDEIIDKLKGCLRSPHGVKCSMFLTGNPGGPGHSAIRRRFISPAPKGGEPIADGEDMSIFIPSNVAENLVLCKNDPKYVQRLKSIRDEKLRRAWLLGDWDVVLGGFFDDVWDPFRNIKPRFKPPAHWTRLMGMDWGTARPFSIGWYAMATGEKVPGYDFVFPPRALVRYAEWYGCKKDETNVGVRLNSTQVALEILQREKERGEDYLIFDRIADPAIFKQDDGPTIAEKFAGNEVVFRKGDNRRVYGWDEVRTMLAGKEQDDGSCPSLLYITENCTELIRTLPLQQREERDWEDLDCFVAGTLVSTPGGQVRIEDLRPGDLVSTPIGPRPVEKNVMSGVCETYVVEDASGNRLEGTPHHKIFIANTGLLPLCVISSGINAEFLTEEKSCLSLSNFKVSNLGENGEGLILSAIRKLLNVMDYHPHFCTGVSGFQLTAQFRQDIISTISMVTDRTTLLRIWNLFVRAITQDCISKKEFKTVTVPPTVRFMCNGDSQKAEKLNFVEMLKLCEIILPKENLRAQIVAALLEQNIHANFAATNAGWREKRQKDKEATLLLQGGVQNSAQFAEQFFHARPIQPKKSRHVDTNAAGNSDAENPIIRSQPTFKKKPVYNLVVEQAHLYYANGVLSSNTDGEDHAVDELRYVCMSRPVAGRTAEDLNRPAGDIREEVSCQRDWEEITDPNQALGSADDMPVNVDTWDFDETGAPLQ